MTKLLTAFLLSAGLPAPTTSGQITISTGVSTGQWVSLPSCSDGGSALALRTDGGLTCVAAGSAAGTTTTPGGSSPQVQYNNSGAFGGISNVTSDGTRLAYTTEATPSAPGSGVLGYNFSPVTGQWPNVPSTIDSFFGVQVPVGFFRGAPFAPNGVAANSNLLATCFIPDAWNTATVGRLGGSSAIATSFEGTGPGTVAWDGTTWVGRQRWQTSVSTAANNATAGVKLSGLISNRVGGFVAWTRAGYVTQQPATRTFFGLANVTTAFTASNEMSVLTDVVYVGNDSNETNLSICSNDNSGTATCSTLGASFPHTAGALYDIWFSAAPSGSALNYYVERLDSAATASGHLTSDLPRSTVQLTWHDVINTGPDAGSNADTMKWGGFCTWDNW